MRRSTIETGIRNRDSAAIYSLLTILITCQTPVEKGGDPEIVRESQRRRFHKVEVVDEIIALDQEWRAGKYWQVFSFLAAL